MVCYILTLNIRVNRRRLALKWERMRIHFRLRRKAVARLEAGSLELADIFYEARVWILLLFRQN